MIKKRSGRHEKTIREFMLEQGKGIRLGPPLKEFQGVLAGRADVPREQQADDEIGASHE